MRLALVSAAVAAFAVSGAACSTGNDEDTVYCVDENQRVVDDDRCDNDSDGGHNYFFWHRSGRHKYSKGSLVSGGQTVRPSDAAGRSRIGIASTGRIGSGTIARGGVGKGSGSSGTSSGG